ncbi:MAG: peptidase [Pirellulaceae bacterium]|nr:peptidase [Pirellulaceae bacterium]
MKSTIHGLNQLAVGRLTIASFFLWFVLQTLGSAQNTHPPLRTIWARPGDTTFEGGGTIHYDGPLSDAGSAFDIHVNIGAGLTQSQAAHFNSAEQFWESKINGYQPGITLTGVTINASASLIDGPGNVLGQAGPTSTQTQGGFTLSTNGIMKFDTADLPALESSGSLSDVVLHEMAHVLGIGNLWDFGVNNLYNNNGQYTGTNGLNRYRSEFNQPTATHIPVELGGGAGTQHGHWDEVNGGDILTGVTDSQGRDMRNELMTGWLDTPTFLAGFTIQSLSDLGYEVVPEPSGASLILGFSLALFAAFRPHR